MTDEQFANFRDKVSLLWNKMSTKTQRQDESLNEWFRQASSGERERFYGCNWADRMKQCNIWWREINE